MSTIPKSLRDGLVGEWLFAGDAKDTSGNGNDGTVNGASLTTDMLGRADRAYDFDGTDYITCDGVTITNSFSYACWFKYTDSTIKQRFVRAYPSGFIIDTSNDVGEGIRAIVYDASSGAVSLNVDSSDLYNDGDWHFIVVVSDYGGDGLSIYIDGVLDGNTATTYVPDLTSSVIIAGDGDGTDGLDGQIALPKIWNRELTATEIQQLYIRGIGTGI